VDFSPFPNGSLNATGEEWALGNPRRRRLWDHSGVVADIALPSFKPLLSEGKEERAPAWSPGLLLCVSFLIPYLQIRKKASPRRKEIQLSSRVAEVL